MSYIILNGSIFVINFVQVCARARVRVRVCEEGGVWCGCHQRQHSLQSPVASITELRRTPAS